MKPTDDATPKAGTFFVKPVGQVSGTLSIDGRNSVLYLWSYQDFDVDTGLNSTVSGTLDDRQPVSLIRPIHIGSERRHTKHGFSRSIRLFPHYVVVGSDSVTETADFVSTVSFGVTDGPTLFADPTAFGMVFDRKDLLTGILEADNKIAPPETCGISTIAYYTGKRDLFSAHTAIGEIIAQHCVGWNWDVSKGASIDNRPRITVKFNGPTSVLEVSRAVNAVVRFLEVVVGYVQNVHDMHALGPSRSEPEGVHLYDNTRTPHEIVRDAAARVSFDDLLDPVRNRASFESVLTHWLDREETWGEARWRVLSSWSYPGRYTEDRLIRAANAFDLIPRSVTGRQKLRHKVAERAQTFSDQIDDGLGGIATILDWAIDLRNIYVHGPSRKPNDRVLKRFVPFLTNTLEFTFVVSDLVDSGWSLREWYGGGKSDAHPFSRYIRNYQYWCDQIEAAMRPTGV